ncbi:hypothetical protein BC827DRAFT_827379 [Russula dissimulans]|nr:hypothetical protein BC827DRAFT_827379 [Russula dissimulans]
MVPQWSVGSSAPPSHCPINRPFPSASPATRCPFLNDPSLPPSMVPDTPPTTIPDDPYSFYRVPFDHAPASIPNYPYSPHPVPFNHVPVSDTTGSYPLSRPEMPEDVMNDSDSRHQVSITWKQGPPFCAGSTRGSNQISESSPAPSIPENEIRSELLFCRLPSCGVWIPRGEPRLGGFCSDNHMAQGRRQEQEREREAQAEILEPEREAQARAQEGMRGRARGRARDGKARAEVEPRAPAQVEQARAQAQGEAGRSRAQAEAEARTRARAQAQAEAEVRAPARAQVRGWRQSCHLF